MGLIGHSLERYEISVSSSTTKLPNAYSSGSLFKGELGTKGVRLELVSVFLNIPCLTGRFAKTGAFDPAGACVNRL